MKKKPKPNVITSKFVQDFVFAYDKLSQLKTYAFEIFLHMLSLFQQKTIFENNLFKTNI